MVCETGIHCVFLRMAKSNSASARCALGACRRLILALFFGLGIFHTAQAQFTAGAMTDIGMAWMPIEPAKSFGWETRPGFGPQVGVFANFNLNRWLFVEGQLNYNYISGRMRREMPNTDVNNNPLPKSFYAHASENLSTLSLPLLLGMRVNWCNLLVGPQINTVLASRERQWGNPIVEGIELQYSNRTRGLPVNAFDIGLKIGLVTSISQRFAIEATYYHGLTNIYDQSYYVGNWRVRQVTYGLRYIIFK